MTLSNKTKIIYLLFIVLSIITTLSLISFSLLTNCYKFVNWNEVIFLSLISSFSIQISLHNLFNKKISIKEYNIVSHSLNIVFSISFLLTSVIMSIYYISKLINC